MQFGINLLALFLTILLFIKFIKKNDKNKNKMIIFIGMFLYVLYQSILTFPLPRIVYFDGDAFEVKRIMNTTRNVNTNFVTVKSLMANTLNEELYFRRVLKDLHPSFSIKAPSLISVKEDAAVSKVLLEESKKKMYIAANKELSNEVRFNKWLVVGPKFIDDLPLKEGDKIITINNFEFNDRDELDNYLRNYESDSFEIKIARDKTHKSYKIELVNDLIGAASMGFFPAEEINLNHDIDSIVDTEGIISGGDSAGLMMALQLYLDIKNIQLKSDTIIAGTGAIDENGTVGKIGGVDHKVNAAYKKGADIFFVPVENYDAAIKQQRKIGAEKMEIVQVKTLNQVIKYLDL